MKIKIDKGFVTNHFWLKVVSLAIAIIVWLYISGEIIKGVRV